MIKHAICLDSLCTGCTQVKDTHLARLSDGDLICGLLKISYPHFPSLDLYDDCVFINSFVFSNTCGKLRKYKRWYMLCFREVLLRDRAQHVVHAVPPVPDHSIPPFGEQTYLHKR